MLIENNKIEGPANQTFHKCNHDNKNSTGVLFSTFYSAQCDEPSMLVVKSFENFPIFHYRSY